MKRIQLISLLVFFTTILFGQNLLNQPESVVYDSLHSRYLVSNWGDGNIIQIDSTGTQSIWLEYVQCYSGLHIREDILYVACREYGVKGFNLNTGELSLHVDIQGDTNINDITSDNFGNLYVSYPSEDVIYKINIATEQCWLFTYNDLDVPNGLYFDEPNNRLLVVSYRANSPIQQISLTDSIATVITYPGLHNLDGITQDNDGNFYVSSWQNNRVYKFDSEFANSPAIFSNHGDDPADIYFDKINNVLAVPLFFTHQVEFVDAGTGIDLSTVVEKPLRSSIYNYPNPFNPTTEIRFQITDFSENEIVTIDIYNIKGQNVKTIPVDSSTAQHINSVIWNGTDQTGKPVSSGMYFSKIMVNGKIEAQNKMILMK